MHKFVYVAAAAALLGACTSEAEEEVVDEPVVQEEIALTDANGETMEAYVGRWDVTYPDGTPGVTTNNPDGTYTAEMADGTTVNGNWTFGAEQSCWQADEARNPTCYTVGASDEDGTRTLTMDDGNTITVTPAAETDGEVM